MPTDRSRPQRSPRRRRRLLGVAVLALLTFAAIVAPAAALAYKGFDSPTQNIGCIMESRGVRCDIRDHDWQSPPKPKNCELDYGGGVFIGAKGRATFVCAGDTTLNSGPALAYGRSAHLGRYRCVSSEAGVRCVNRRTGHGFLLSRQKAHLF
jgi:hypothetical protein